MIQVEVAKDDMIIFRNTLNDFLRVCNNSIGNEKKDKNGKIIPNYVENGKTKRISLETEQGLELHRKYAFGVNTLTQYPYINIGWINLIYDWESKMFEGPSLIISSGNKKSDFKKTFSKNVKIYSNESSTYDSKWELSNDKNKLKNSDDYERIFTRMIDLYHEMSYLNDEAITTNIEVNDVSSYKKYTTSLLNSKNVIFRGAPGTGKSYLAKNIAALIASDNRTTNYNDLTIDEKEQIEFVQFHPSYDYTDFVEGIRPFNSDNSVGFILKSGIFKSFCETVKIKNKMNEIVETKLDFEGFKLFMENLGSNEAKNYLPIIQRLLGEKKYTGRKIDTHPVYNSLEEIISNYEEIKQIDEDYEFRNWLSTPVNYLIKYKQQIDKNKEVKTVKMNKKYVFIIDEINRGEISKIFGELFFSIDPDYRGEKGSVNTQYSNMQEEKKSNFFVPENVYIIGTMNDIDRSVDSFDFAMRRRFRFIEIKAEESTGMWNGKLAENEIPIASSKMSRLNNMISNIEGLNSNYHIGPSYFLKLPELDYNYSVLWEDYISPLLEEYTRGMYDENKVMEELKLEYLYGKEVD